MTEPDMGPPGAQEPAGGPTGGLSGQSICPVCGYPGLTEPPLDYSICPCCLTEFGYDDVGASHGELRAWWLQSGAPWRSAHTPKPSGWDPIAQLRAAGLIDSDQSHQRGA